VQHTGRGEDFYAMTTTGPLPDPAATPSPAAADPDTHVVGITENGRLQHTIRHPDGRWDRWGEREGPQGAAFTGAGCAVLSGALHVCAVSADGRLFHTVRFPDGRWDRWGEPDRPRGDPLVAVDCTGKGEDLHVCAVGAQGRVFHTIRHPDGRWDRWGEPDGPESARGVATA
jgi:hypothetical protein